MITFDDFKNTELRVATILAAERVEGSDKLLKLRIALGEEERQLVSGIGKAYEPEALVGTQVVVVANLEPRSLMGLESQGMLLAASGENGPALLRPDHDVASGSEVR